MSTQRALAEQVAKERRLGAMADAIAAYEAEFGEVSEQEMAAQRRADRAYRPLSRRRLRVSEPVKPDRRM